MTWEAAWSALGLSMGVPSTEEAANTVYRPAYAGKPRPAALTTAEMKALNRAIFVFLGLSETEIEKG